MNYEYLLLSQRDTITTVTLNRPDKRNALAMEVMLELTQALREIAAGDALGVILAANGPVFSAGHNFADMAGATEAQALELFRVCTVMMDTLQSLPQPVIAKVHALATAAGCQLVATCDLAVAADTASFAIPGGKAGLFCHTPLVAVARVLDREFVQAELRAHFLQLGVRGVAQRHPDEAIRSNDIIADIGDRNVGQLFSVLIGDAIDQHVLDRRSWPTRPAPTSTRRSPCPGSTASPPTNSAAPIWLWPRARCA